MAASSVIQCLRAGTVPLRGTGRSARMQHTESNRNDEGVRVRNSGHDAATTDCKLAVSSSTLSSAGYHYRRDLLQLGAAFVIGGSLILAPENAAAEEEDRRIQTSESVSKIDTTTITDKAFSADRATQRSQPVSKVDTTITDKVFFDLSICPNASRTDRTLGNTSLLCTTGEPLGRIVLGLYGRLVPQTVKNFKAMVSGVAGTSYAGTIFHRVLPGQYIQGGRQGSKDKGEIAGPLKLDRNLETVDANAYKLSHSRPGTLSLALSENDDDEELKLDVDYRNVQFLITTGPGPAPQLDNGNIVFGTVLEGLDVVAAVANVPTYRPNSRIKQFNDFAEFLGDERAANARNFWDRPLKTVVISRCGEIPVGLPVFPPGLP